MSFSPFIGLGGGSVAATCHHSMWWPRVKLKIFVLGRGGGAICVTNLLSMQASIHLHTSIHTHTHKEFSIFHSEILKIKCYIELNSSFTIFYSEILKIFIFNVSYQIVYYCE